jgi:hypothetical protein
MNREKTLAPLLIAATVFCLSVFANLATDKGCAFAQSASANQTYGKISGTGTMTPDVPYTVLILPPNYQYDKTSADLIRSFGLAPSKKGPDATLVRLRNRTKLVVYTYEDADFKARWASHVPRTTREAGVLVVNGDENLLSLYGKDSKAVVKEITRTSLFNRLYLTSGSPTKLSESTEPNAVQVMAVSEVTYGGGLLDKLHNRKPNCPNCPNCPNQPAPNQQPATPPAAVPYYPQFPEIAETSPQEPKETPAAEEEKEKPNLAQVAVACGVVCVGIYLVGFRSRVG